MGPRASSAPAVHCCKLTVQVRRIPLAPRVVWPCKCSINNIKTLKYFRHNIKLRELYLRRNDIADLSELGYLAQLMDLKVWGVLASALPFLTPPD